MTRAQSAKRCVQGVNMVGQLNATLRRSIMNKQEGNLLFKSFTNRLPRSHSAKCSHICWGLQMILDGSNVQDFLLLFFKFAHSLHAGGYHPPATHKTFWRKHWRWKLVEQGLNGIEESRANEIVFGVAIPWSKNNVLSINKRNKNRIYLNVSGITPRWDLNPKICTAYFFTIYITRPQMRVFEWLAMDDD